MSDHSISIVPKKSNYPNNKDKAKEILEWLVTVNIVQATLSDCVLSANMGYAISKVAINVCSQPEYLPFELITNGLEIITERTVFHTGENGIDTLICATCHQDIALENWDFLNPWVENISNNLTCPLCHKTADIHQYRFTPEWGFSDLGFTFWNWPDLTDNFLIDFKKRLDCDVNLVYSWL